MSGYLHDKLNANVKREYLALTWLKMLFGWSRMRSRKQYIASPIFSNSLIRHQQSVLASSLSLTASVLARRPWNRMNGIGSGPRGPTAQGTFTAVSIHKGTLSPSSGRREVGSVTFLGTKILLVIWAPPAPGGHPGDDSASVFP